MSWRKLLLISLPMAALALSAFFNNVNASADHNIRGRAYNPLYGLISFNCLDDDFAGRFPFVFTFRFNVPPCSLSQHGVHLDIDNNFSGEAWNPVLGFIDMAPNATPPDSYAFNVNCTSVCNAGNDCTACYNEIDQRVYGWARVIVDGRWIELNSSISPQTTMTNYLAPQPGIFSGYASSTFGGISFNCSNDSSCSTEEYKVWLWKLELKELSGPNWSFGEACNSGARKAVFKWLRRSGIQTAYRVVVNTTNSTSSPVFDSGKISGSASQLVCPGPLCLAFTPAYNTSYYWWLQLWNENDEPTEYFQFDTNTFGVLTDNIAGNAAANPGNANLTFTTYRHEFPTPYFTWSPFEILVATSTEFVSSSTYYTTGQPSTAQPCVGPACQYQWTASHPSVQILASTSATTTIIFANILPQTITLRVTDADLYYCSMTSPTLTINYQLPIWKEVKAE